MVDLHNRLFYKGFFPTCVSEASTQHLSPNFTRSCGPPLRLPF